MLFAYVSFINNAKWKLLRCQKLRPYAVLLSASKTGKGGFKHKHANLRHILTKKATKRKRHRVRKPWFPKAIWAWLSRACRTHKSLTFNFLT